MRRTGLTNRLDQIAASRNHVGVTSLARRIAEVAGLSEMELFAEAERIADACHWQGIASRDGMVRYVAEELGITAEELEGELARYRELAP